MDRKFGALSSSVNPQELSKTVEGIVKLVTGVLVTFGLVSTVDANTVLTQIPIVVTAAYSAWGGLEMIWGIIRKLIVRFYQ